MPKKVLVFLFQKPDSNYQQILFASFKMLTPTEVKHNEQATQIALQLKLKRNYIFGYKSSSV